MNGKIVMNHDVLLPEHLPSKLIFRDDEFRELETSVQNRVSILLVGPVGSGKTSIVKLLQSKIGQERLVYVDCLVHDTEYAVLKAIVPSVRAAFMRSSFELIGELRRISQSNRMAVCFDNFTRLEDMDVIDKVIALGVTVILVSSVERDLKLLGPNSMPRLRRVIHLKNYSSGEALRILRKRAEEGLARDSYNDDVLDAIVASTNGNITLGINVLRAAALKAETGGRSRIAREDLEGILPRREEIEMSEDERAIMRILREKHAVEHKQLYNLYCQSVASPKQERTFKNYMQRLIGKTLVRVDFSDGQRTYKVVEYV